MGTSATVARVGFGGAPIGGLYAAVSDDAARATLEAAWSGGIRHYDTAPLYGSGLSERRLGAFLAGKPRDGYRISTKVGRVLVPARGGADESGSLGSFAGGLPFDAVFDFSAGGIRRELEASLTRLRLQYVDIAFIHDPDDHLDQAIRESYPELLRLRDEGLVRAIGAGMNSSAALSRLVRACDLDAVLVAGRYTLLDREAAAELLPLCEQRGVEVIAAGVFNSGILAQRVPADDGRYDYQVAEPETVARARAIARTCERYGVPLPAAAIAFTLGHPAIASIVLGMRDPAQVAEDLAYASAVIPDALWSDLANDGVARP